ncbi:WGR domain-containing protein [Dechloromonas sp. XY25]|uniref:WGR domain-containing protein n=1 Tax=Dechloromonas hankyongensis TaxID=2908002 RepID=A0ABS9K6D7_9RHOO|nr:WGR domain-containing protein [Dechloromonas hankyongensis]MCG2578711.1 WGR domain-containing protein [Dechloromonas hankyongensis]
MLPLPRRFETAHRYYVLCCSRDLWGELVVSRYWGGKDNQRGQQRHEVVANVAMAEQRVTALARQRQQHGYREVAG